MQQLLVYDSPFDAAEGLRDAVIASVTLAESSCGLKKVAAMAPAAFRAAVLKEADYEGEGDSDESGDDEDPAAANDEDVEDGRSPEAKAVAVLTEVLVAMLANASHFVREATRPIFHSLCPLLTSEAVATVLDVVVGAPAEEEAGEGEESDEEMEGSDEESDDSDEEKGEGGEEGNEEEEEEEEGEQSEEEEEDGEGATEGTPSAPAGEDDDSDSEVDIDLEAIVGEEEAADMRRQDAALANIIRLRKAQKVLPLACCSCGVASDCFDIDVCGNFTESSGNSCPARCALPLEGVGHCAGATAVCSGIP